MITESVGQENKREGDKNKTEVGKTGISTD